MEDRVFSKSVLKRLAVQCPPPDAEAVEELKTADSDMDGLEETVRLLRRFPFPRASGAEGPGKVRFNNLTAEANDEYVGRFLPPRFNRHGVLSCAGCGIALAGMLGAFEWGIRHGEGVCSACGWPGRGAHYIGEPEVRVDFVFQYHPDEFRFGE